MSRWCLQNLREVKRKILLSIYDTFSKFILLLPLHRATEITIVQLIEEHVFLLFGCPQNLICDNGPQFRSKGSRSFVTSMEST